MGLLNVGSLVFGLIAWALPIMNLIGKNKDQPKKVALLSILSLMSCLIALYMQILYKHFLVSISDWAALLDTMYAVEIMAGILLIVTVVLNLLSFRLMKESE